MEGNAPNTRPEEHREGSIEGAPKGVSKMTWVTLVLLGIVVIIGLLFYAGFFPGAPEGPTQRSTNANVGP